MSSRRLAETKKSKISKDVLTFLLDEVAPLLLPVVLLSNLLPPLDLLSLVCYEVLDAFVNLLLLPLNEAFLFTIRIHIDERDGKFLLNLLGRRMSLHIRRPDHDVQGWTRVALDKFVRVRTPPLDLDRILLKRLKQYRR